MKRFLLVIALILLAGCAAVSQRAPTAEATDGSGASFTALLSQLPGEYDNHAQVWAAQQAGQSVLPVHVRQQIRRVADQDHAWTWQLSMPGQDNKTLAASWRYQLRSLPDGRLQMTPSRQLSGDVSDQTAQWAELAPCAMEGAAIDGRLQLAADQQACSAVLNGLGGSAALVPLILDFDGRQLIIKTYSDIARGAEARQIGQRVQQYRGWAAINGAGPDAEADSKDWHMQRDLKIGNQGQGVAIRWRDGSASGYSLQLERLHYQKRDMQVLRLSLVRDADGGTVAYVWADPDARHIGLNLGWVQIGLQRVQDGPGDGGGP